MSEVSEPHIAKAAGETCRWQEGVQVGKSGADAFSCSVASGTAAGHADPLCDGQRSELVSQSSQCCSCG